MSREPRSSRTAGRAAALTRQLLAFGRQQVLAPQVIDLNKTIASVELMVRRLMGEDLDVTFRLDAHGHVLVDRGQLEQLLMNLIVDVAYGLLDPRVRYD